jgi:HEAT repeat protein
MTTNCPACNKTVDSLRSRFVGVQDGKIVAYCSAECASRAKPSEPAPPAPPAMVVAVASPAAGVRGRIPTPPAGVPARVQTPATGVPLGPLGPPRPMTPAPGVPIDPTRLSGVLDSGPVIEILHEPASGVVTSARDERTEPSAKLPGEIPIAELSSTGRDSSGAVRAAGEPGSVPVALPEAGGHAASDPRTAAERRRAVRSPPERGAGDPQDSQDSQDSGDDLDTVPPRKSRVPLVILLLLLLGAGGYLTYQYFLKGNLAAATKVMPAPAARASPLEGTGGSREPATPRGASGNPQDQAIVEPHPPARRAAAAPPVFDVNSAVEQARATLHGDLTATSPRVQRIAAEALARTQDPAARDVLAAQLGLPAAEARQLHAGATATPQVRERETSDIAKLDVAYSLARGGDPRGAQALAAALRSQRAEVRDEAARLLALLGDARAIPHLTDLLAVSQRRLGAAEHLAHLAEPHAIKVLEQLRGDAKTSADDRARATIALGIARHADVASALRDMLGDPHENAFAAAALAELKDAAARPVLEQQLDSPALRVRAARALRRLDPALDPKPVLARLVEVLKTGRDIDQVQAAEAILLLAGPASWSAYD